jgi:proteasome lid subunit RPN8/RPN11
MNDHESMSNELEIQLGEVEEQKPEVRLRPDFNKHFGVVEIYAPQDDELPVFVDLDAMRDMEDHALSDTSVELGGVMLGGQYEDEEGRPFVLVTDSLRAQHYESTKGSFKFTHDTWSQITRERDEFPDELQMVGWYHTHPDWGVFLSGMDMFICDNFFNKKLDVALVIDPCRQDRGFFQWTGDPAERTRRTGGFYLVASRFRQYELEEYVSYLQGKFAMSGDPRFRGVSGSAPVVNVGGQQAWQSVAVLGMLAMQFCFLMLIAWKLLLPEEPGDVEAKPEIAAVQASIDKLAEAQRTRNEVDAKLEVLDGVIGKWDGTQGPILESLTAKTSEIDDLRSRVRGQEAVEKELDTEVKRLNSDLAKAAGREQRLENMIASLEARGRLNQEKIEQLEAKLGHKSPADKAASAEKEDSETSDSNWRWWAGGAAALALAVAIAAFLVPRQDAEESSEEIQE